MPGPVSDSYDPEWGTSANGAKVDEALEKIYSHLTKLLGNKAPIYILDLVRDELPNLISATLSEKEWRLLRFAVERARDSL